MDIKIKYTKLPNTPEIEKYISKKMNSLDRLIGRSKSNLTVFIEIARTSFRHRRGKDVYYTEATMKVKGKTIRVQSTDSSIWASVDKVKDILKRKLRKIKERRISH